MMIHYNGDSAMDEDEMGHEDDEDDEGDEDDEDDEDDMNDDNFDYDR